MQSAHSKEINLLQKNHEEALAALKRSLSTDSQAAIDVLRKQHADEINRIKEAHEDAVRQLNAGFEKRVTQIELDAAKQQQQMQDRHDSETKKLEGQIKNLKD